VRKKAERIRKELNVVESNKRLLVLICALEESDILLCWSIIQFVDIADNRVLLALEDLIG
jgi:hypothetical protein